MRTLVLGATGYIGTRLVPELLGTGYDVRCLVRDPAKVPADQRKAEIVQGDVLEPTSVKDAMRDVDVVYFLVHSMESKDFSDLDRQAAENVVAAAEAEQVGRIVYLGGLQPEDDQRSEHLTSRGEVGDIFLRSSVPASVFQAAMVTGSGSASFEMVRHLTELLPVMITPRWVHNKAQPIGIDDMIRYLAGAAELPSDVDRTFDVGGPDVLTYQDMMRRYARVAGLPSRPSLPVPLFSPLLSSYWVALITPVSRAVAAPLIESLRHELVCREDDIRRYLPDPPEGLLDYDDSVRRAVEQDPVTYVEERTLHTTASPTQLWGVVESIGGRNGWYTLPLVWRLRGWLDQAIGGVGAFRGRPDPDRLSEGDILDWWRVEEVDAPERLLLRAEMKMPGTARLEMSVTATPDGGADYRQRVSFVPSGLSGHLYWWSQRLGHEVVFAIMARGVVSAAEA